MNKKRLQLTNSCGIEKEKLRELKEKKSSK